LIINVLRSIGTHFNSSTEMKPIITR
jgi:hypothetical protein